MLSHSSSMAVRSCWILAGLEHAVVHVDPKHPKRTQWGDMPVEYAGHGRTGTFPASRNCGTVGPCNMMLKNEVMAAEERHDNGPQDLFTVSLCIQIAINKMQLCLFSIAFTCLYHNPTATMGHSVHNVDISKPLAHTRPYHSLPSVLYS